MTRKDGELDRGELRALEASRPLEIWTMQLVLQALTTKYLTSSTHRDLPY